MTREIKFRAYSRKLWMSKAFKLTETINADINEFEVFMQYTWLKDKSWREICEGDILKTWLEITPALQVKHWVTEIDDNEGYGINRISWVYLESIKEFWGGHHKYHPDDVEIYEIIWNIYENPDLLTNFAKKWLKN